MISFWVKKNRKNSNKLKALTLSLLLPILKVKINLNLVEDIRDITDKEATVATLN